MGPRSRVAVAAYLEVFLLIGLAVGGSGIVFEGALGSLGSAQGASVLVSGATIRQGVYSAFESLTIQNTGTVGFRWFELSTSGVSASAVYCFTLYDPLGPAVVSSTCPAMSASPATVSFSTPLSPGRAILAELTLIGSAFTVGSVSNVAVTTSAGAQQSLQVLVVPA